MKEYDRSKYFQEIAHFFLKARGAPLFLSSVDIDMIVAWEKMGIPLRIVLEGIDKAFESSRLRPGSKRKIRSLSSCKFHVMRAFDQYRDRNVGIRREKVTRDGRRRKIRKEVDEFLQNIPHELIILEEVLRRARALLSRREVDEEALERIEEEIEELLSRQVSSQERKSIREMILKEFPRAEKAELDSLLQIKLVKHLRDKYRIPYISFYYY